MCPLVTHSDPVLLCTQTPINIHQTVNFLKTPLRPHVSARVTTTYRYYTDLDIRRTFYDICIIHFMETDQLQCLVTYIVVTVSVSHVDDRILKSSGSYKP